MRYAIELLVLIVLLGGPVQAAAQETAQDAQVVSAISSRLLQALAQQPKLPLLTATAAPIEHAAEPVERPATLQALSIAFGAATALDWYSTTVAMNKTGTRELNPTLAKVASNPVALLATKAAMAGTTIYVAHRLSRHHRVAAITALVAANVITSAVIAHNYSVARG